MKQKSGNHKGGRMVFLYFASFIALVVVIAIIVAAGKSAGFNKKVRDYSNSHKHTVIVKYHNNFIAIDDETQEFTYISPQKLVTFTQSQLAGAEVIETERTTTSDPGAPEEYSVDVQIHLENHQTRIIEIQCVYSARRDTLNYNQGHAYAQVIKNAIVKFM